MAEGGYSPEDLDPTKLNETGNNDDDDYAWDGMGLKTFSSTSQQNNYYEEEEETPIDGINEKWPLLGSKINEQEESENEIKRIYPRSKFKNFLSSLKDIGAGIKVPTISLNRKGAAKYVLLDGEFQNEKTGSKKLPDALKDALGKRAEDIVEDIDIEIKKKKETLNKKIERAKFLEDKPLKTPEENNEIENINREIVEDNEDIANDERERERIQDRMSLRERVKAIFKKHGFTVFAVLSAVGVVIGVIVSSLSKGLSTLGRGVGNGLKTLGKKLGNILPGMVGAIVSFLFKTAGQVIGFLGKNAWFLIMAVVLYFVDRLKRGTSIKNKRK